MEAGNRASEPDITGGVYGHPKTAPKPLGSFAQECNRSAKGEKRSLHAGHPGARQRQPHPSCASQRQMGQGSAAMALGPSPGMGIRERFETGSKAGIGWVARPVVGWAELPQDGGVPPKE